MDTSIRRGGGRRGSGRIECGTGARAGATPGRGGRCRRTAQRARRAHAGLLVPRRHARRHLSRTLVADIALGLGVLAVTASFPFDPPPRAIAAAQRDAAEGVTIIVAARDGQATLTLLPGQPGTNRLEAWVTDASGVAVAAKEATVSTALLEAGIEPARSPAAMPRPGVYVAEELAIPRAGRWRVRLDLLVDDFTKLTFEGEIIVGDQEAPDHHHTSEIRGWRRATGP